MNYQCSFCDGVFFVLSAISNYGIQCHSCRKRICYNCRRELIVDRGRGWRGSGFFCESCATLEVLSR